MDTKLQVAQMILEQLGGHKFKVMTGAKNFVGGPDSLSFTLPKCKDGINGFMIVLTPDDLYRVEALRCNRRAAEPRKVVESMDGVYNDMLQGVFERMTGLRTKLF